MAREGGGAAAIVIGGAVVKGAFAAGALGPLVEKLQEEGTPIRALVGTSSGALNATVMAAGVHAGDPVNAARTLETLWLERAGFLQVYSPNLEGVVRWNGISRSDRIVAALEEACPRTYASGPKVDLRLVTAPLAGLPGEPTSFEHVARFDGGDLDTQAGRERIFAVATASAAFPYVFAPVTVDGVGPCLDGGLVNNTPVKHAIAQNPEVDSVYVISANPADMRISEVEAEKLGGAELGFRLAEIVIEERLVRDLDEAEAVNAWLDTLERLQQQNRIDAATRDEIVSGLYPDRPPATFREIEIVSIRPGCALKGTPFDGLFSPSLRRSYVENGRRAAVEALERRRVRAA